ncbi:ATP-binding cassette sub-family C member 4-like isoform X2 [Dysidea avara]
MPEYVKSQKLLEHFNKYWNRELKRTEKELKPRLWFALFQTFKWILILHGVLYYLMFLPPIGQAILVGYLSNYFCEKNSLEEELSLLRAGNNSELVVQKEEDIRVATRNAYLYAAGIMMIACYALFIYAWTFYIAYQIGMMHRITLTAAIYSKVIRLSQSTIGQLSIGHIINLSSNDVQQFDLGFELFPEVVVVPVYFPVVAYLLWREVGPSCLVALAVVVLQPPVQYISLRLYAKWRLKAAKVTDNRVRVMNEIISGMRLIKMYAWEWAFHEYVKKIRKKESRIITQGSLIHAFNTAFLYVSMVVLNFVTFSTYTGSGNDLTPRKVFSALILFSFMKLFFIEFMVICLLHYTEMYVALQRIEKLLLMPELDNQLAIEERSSVNKLHKQSDDKLATEEATTDSVVGTVSYGSSPRIVVSNISASWTHDREKLVLNSISFTVDKSNRLLAVVGPVGSGKSSILQCLLRELKALDGSVDIEGSVSYASQDPWIFSGTLKENIIFGELYDEVWYKRVVECCSLVKDIDEMPFGDETLIGERGVNLSGGQKARVNLARAVYRDNDIMLLDDPLSAVDAAVSRHLFDRCICGLLADKIVVLVTHQLQYAQHANSILVLKKGCVQGYGNYDQLTSSGVDPTELFDDIEDNNKSLNDMVVLDVVVEECEDTTGLDQVPANSRSQEHLHLLPVERARRRVKVGLSRSSPNLSVDHVKLEEALLYTTPSLYSLVSIHDDVNVKKIQTESKYNTVPEEERAHGTISNKTYFTYVREGGNIFLAILLIAVYLVSEGSIVTANWWISHWASEGESCSAQLANISFNATSDFDLTTHQRIGIYGGIVAFVVVATVIKAGFSFVTSLNSSRNLHNKMFKAILRAPILFFDTNPVGRVLNRFSSDIGLMDSLLPYMFLQFFTLLLMIFSYMLIACVANHWLSIPAVVIIVSLTFLRYYFLHASRGVQRLEALARSPLYSHISATIQGLTTIRAYKEQTRFMNKLHFYSDEHSKAWYTKLSAAQWFGIRLDMIGVVFVTLVMFCSIPLADSLDPALVGLSMAYAVDLTGLVQYTIRISAEVEDLLVSVERVMGYSKLESEAELMSIQKDKTPPLAWPENGAIKLDKLKFRYAADYPYVLKSVSVTMQPSEKVGIVGRTGAGKSSLLAALFRLAEPEGVFEIDGIQITDIGLHDLRKNISIIPQDPVLFSGTVRYNLDPFREHDNDKLWDALKEVQLEHVILGLEEGLDAEVSEGGSNFSVGQRQLICLARALLRRNKILVIDEATANVDLITDGIIQEMIRSKFTHCTILTIAHRLETIIDSDRILVLSSGKVSEFDAPYNLLQTPHSVFSSMVERTGSLESARLKKIAFRINEEKLKSGNTCI